MLEVTNERGCKNKISKEINIKPAPNVEFQLDKFIGCQPFIVNVKNTTLNDSVAVNNSFFWQTSTNELKQNLDSTSFTFFSDGLQEISLSVTNTLGCTNSSSANVFVKQSPILTDLNISKIPACYNDSITITAKGSPQNSSFIWNDTNTVIFNSISQNITTAYFNSGGLLTSRLTINNNGCSSDTLITFNVYEKPKIAIDTFPNVLCQFGSQILSLNPSIAQNYKVVLNDKTVNNSKNNKVLLNNLQLTNDVKITLTDVNGCKQDTSIILNTTSKPSLSLSTNSINDTICIGSELIANVKPSNLDMYSYFLDNVKLTDTISNSLNFVNISKNSTISIIGKKDGCSDTVTKVIKVKIPTLAPSINCIESSFNSITYNFNTLENAKYYEISTDGINFVKISSSGTYISKDLDPDTEYNLVLKSVLKGEYPCDSILISNAPVCKTIPCEKLDFDLSPIQSEICENGNVTYKISNIVSPSGQYIIYWNNTKGTNTELNTGNLTIKDSPFKIEVSIEDSTRSKGCTKTTKSAIVYIDPKPDSTNFRYSFELNKSCETTSNLVLNVINPNPIYHYYFSKNNDIDTTFKYYNMPVSIPYSEKDSSVYLITTSEHFACNRSVKQLIEPIIAGVKPNPVIYNIVSSYVLDSIQCTMPDWTYHYKVKFDSLQLISFLNTFPGIINYKIARTVTETSLSINGPTQSSILGNYLKNEIHSSYKSSNTIVEGNTIGINDTIKYYNEYSCPIAYSTENDTSFKRLNECHDLVYKYCANKKDTVTIKDLEKEYECFNSVSDLGNYFSEEPQGYKLVDSFTVVRIKKSSNTEVTIKNKKLKCLETTLKLCAFYCDTALYIPNAISPNNDGFNDKWEIKGGLGKKSIKIYNRWEQLVYSSDDYQNNFEGYSNDGILMSDGLYYFELRIDGVSHLNNDKMGLKAKTYSEISQYPYSIFDYDCEEKPFGELKGKLLIFR